MLIRYKKNFEKIAMGLLSFMPSEKELKKLQSTIRQYETEKDWLLYLWKEGEDVIGLIGIVIESEEIHVRHISVNPSFRCQGIGKRMLNGIEEMYAEKTVVASDETSSFFEKCHEEQVDPF